MKKKVKVRLDKSGASDILDDCIKNKKVIPRRVFQIMVEEATVDNSLTDSQLFMLLKELPWSTSEEKY